MSELTAGHELDTLIAEKITGWTQMQHDLSGIPPQDWSQYLLPRYSTDIAAAFQVVDKLLDGTRAFALECWDQNATRWTARFVGKLNEETIQYEQLAYAFAETRPLAICHAALKVVAEEESCES